MEWQSWFVKSRRAQSTDDYETWIQGGVSPTLNAFDNGNDTRATVLIFTAQRVGEPPRIYHDITPSLLSRMGTGGNNTPMIAAYSIREDAKANTFSATETDVSLALNALQPSPQSHHAQMFIADVPDEKDAKMISFDGYNQSADDSGIHRTPRIGIDSGDCIANETVVRRLTPLECERLMGWPDNHTLHRADNKTNSDSTRYKMCGNGVASPVAHWIALQLKNLLQ